MKLDRPIIFLDTECTSLDPATSRIIELGVSVLHPDGSLKPNGWSVRFNPGCPIPAESTEVHRIKDEDVKDCPPFASYAPKLQASIMGKDICGYNCRKLDLIVLDEEMRRCGLRLDLTGVRIIDCFGIFQKKHPRDLAAAVELYVGRKHDDAHGAAADAMATYEVLIGQMKAHGDLDSMTLDELEAFSRHGEYPFADLAGKLYYDSDGDLCYAFGQHRDKKVRDEQRFGRWMMGKDFPGSTLDVLELEFQRILHPTLDFGHGHDEPPV